MKMRLPILFKPLTAVQTVQPVIERITYLLEQLLWVDVLKNLEHLGKLVLKEALSLTYT